MKLIGLAVIVSGWLISVGGILFTSSNLSRILIACSGIGVSIYGILGVLNRYYLARAIWKK